MRADLKAELCVQEGCNPGMVTVDRGTVEEGAVTLVSEARKIPCTRRFQLNQTAMNQFVASNSSFSLFVRLKALGVDGQRQAEDSQEESESKDSENGSEEGEEARAEQVHVPPSHPPFVCSAPTSCPRRISSPFHGRCCYHRSRPRCSRYYR